ncbi:DUF4254 domain-containing protein [Nocardia altamirensis]|uniref:DUF4254 domain-containing protein n=1 Tax=Nocardia altamirensis TaxID=472158 RepID=UPI0008400822|nr:DUF4254 domain-containing protein [Nocardia altamirensis]
MTEQLPTRSQVLQACRAEVDVDHPILGAARELAVLHERKLVTIHENICGIDEYRAKQVRDIDRWVAVNLPVPHGGAYLHTETVGAILDRLAQLTACANAAGASEWDIWFAWERLAELAIGYEDLAAELAAGRRRLPNRR